MNDSAFFNPSDLFMYTGDGSIVPWNVRRAEVHRSVKFIPDRSFKNCWQLESVLLHEGLLGIGEEAFQRCSLLRIVRCPSTVTKIGGGAFRGCWKLATIELPKGLESIEGGTFYECRSLEEVKIPTLVRRIGNGAFSLCTNLASIGLREGLRAIGDCAFDGCSSLENLSVPSSVKEIREHAFDGCSGLSLVQLHEDLPRMKRFVFRGCPPESFRFVRLSGRMGAMRMDDRTTSMFESRLNEITYAMTRHYDERKVADPIWEKCKKSLERAHEFLDYLELEGAMSVLELALWKAKIEGRGEEGVREGCADNKEGGQELSDAGRERKRPQVTKNIGQDTRLCLEDCRVKCGGGIVIPEVLKFFTYRSSWPRLDDSEEGNVD